MKQLQEIADGSIERKRKRWEQARLCLFTFPFLSFNFLFLQCVEPWAEAKECRDSNSNRDAKRQKK
jgi:hypothetical protein